MVDAMKVPPTTTGVAARPADPRLRLQAGLAWFYDTPARRVLIGHIDRIRMPSAPHLRQIRPISAPRPGVSRLNSSPVSEFSISRKRFRSAA